MSDRKGCSHGKTWAERCIKCEIISTSDVLNSHRADVARLEKRLAEVRALEAKEDGNG